MEREEKAWPSLGELVPVRTLLEDPEVLRVFPGPGALEWELRQHRREYVAAGAIFEIGRRLLAHPATFKRTALLIGMQRLAERIGADASARAFT